MSCSVRSKSLITTPPGLPLRKRFMRTLCPSIWSHLVPSRWNVESVATLWDMNSSRMGREGSQGSEYSPTLSPSSPTSNFGGPFWSLWEQTKDIQRHEVYIRRISKSLVKIYLTNLGDLVAVMSFLAYEVCRPTQPYVGVVKWMIYLSRHMPWPYPETYMYCILVTMWS